MLPGSRGRGEWHCENPRNEAPLLIETKSGHRHPEQDKPLSDASLAAWRGVQLMVPLERWKDAGVYFVTSQYCVRDGCIPATVLEIDRVGNLVLTYRSAGGGYYVDTRAFEARMPPVTRERALAWLKP